ncbi:spidroin-1-like isoform X1 [Triticum urartu]|uniref:WRC domain-containing protein n=1 Tax=Triticum urartu TaxID=4572 RepID=A0A8R7V4V3_TRIUA|nr:spidroin-1-like isoform X1 [Triticum urartu]
MRIRRRPQQPSPYTAALLHHQQQYRSDPSTSTHQTPRNAEERGQGRGGDEEEEEGRARPPHPHANADLGRKPAAARRLALPQDNAVEGQGAAAEHGADGAHSSSNGHGGVAGWKPDVACTGAGERAVKVEDPVANGVAALSDVKEEKNGSGGAAGGAKKRRGPAVLMEGSRCSRVNGRGWRCSQPTLVGYSLCEHHLGKGRMRSAAAAAAAGVGGGGRGGPGQLGRTEHRARMPVGVAVTTAAAKAEEPGLRPY